MSKKKGPDPLDQISEDVHAFWVQARKEAHERIIPNEHWIWPTIFAAFLLIGIYGIPKLILRFCEWINYKYPM